MINEATREALGAPAVQEAFEYHQARLRDLFSGQQLESPFVLNGIGRSTEDDSPDWETWLDDALAYLAERTPDACNREVFRPLTVNYNPHGVHFVDGLFGADVFLLDGAWQVRLLSTPVGALERPDLEADPTWRASRDCALKFRDYNVPNVTFGLPVIASALNVAVNLYGEEILVAMLQDPEAARHDLRVIGDVLRELHLWYLANLPARRYQCTLPGERFQLPGCGQLCGCTTQLISANTYSELIAPLDDELLSLYAHGGMIHLCGSHTQHLATWLSVPSFRAIQINNRAAQDIEAYFHGLRDNQVIYVNTFEGMPFGRILDITDGRRVVIVEDREQLPDTEPQ